MKLLKNLQNENKIHPPKFLVDNVHYATIMGSMAYGCNTDESDYDVYGFCIPTKNDIFPHLDGHIEGFGRQKKRFDCWQEHHVQHNKKEYDFSIFSIIRYFHLCMEANPNMVNSLFTPQDCVLHCTKIGQHVRDNRTLFLSKKCLHTFRGYAFSQIHKLEIKEPQEGTRRAEYVKTFGFDAKFAYHCLRLLLECEQIFQFGDMDLRRDREMYKSIRRGEWTIQQIKEFFETKEKYLESLYETSSLPYEPREAEIKKLLIECLEIQYGNLSNVIKCEYRENEDTVILNKIRQLLS